jgi:hypothetical protein
MEEQEQHLLFLEVLSHTQAVVVAVMQAEHHLLEVLVVVVLVDKTIQQVQRVQQILEEEAVEQEHKM